MNGDEELTSEEPVIREDDSDFLEIHEPYIGQVFNDLEKVYCFYNEYARKQGFGIRKNSSSKSLVTKELIWKNYVCDKAGKKISVTTHETQKMKQRRETRVDCKAKLDVRRNKEGCWVVTGFVKEHNHELDTPRRAKKHRSHHIYHITDIAKSTMENLNKAGVGPSMIAKSLNATGVQTEISTQNVIDHLRKQRKTNTGQEGVLVAQYLQAQALKDPNFYYVFELDSDGYLRSLFWADSRARSDYITFGDVIVFDVTYKTNKLLMPFAPFTGVNHHRQSILFGCALLIDETEETFEWLFRNWLACMFHKAPKVILTDMDRAMFNSIQTIFPNTRHRFCSWHIHKHLLENVYEMRDGSSDFCKDYKQWYNSRNVTVCESSWNDLIVKYSLQNHKWLSKMWTLRNHWVPAYLKNVFVAGMTSTSRSESINSFFDGFVNSNTHLLDFVKQTEHAVACRRNSEESEDYKTMNSIASLVGNTSIEIQASQCYTRSMFSLFQNEFRQILDCGHEKIVCFGNTKQYLVGLSTESKHKWYIVQYVESENLDVRCECAHFETQGYLCKHILHIFFKKQIAKIPEQYILKRWTIQARYILPCTALENDHFNDVAITPVMKWSLLSLCHKLVEKCSTSHSSFRDLYNDITQRLEDCNLDIHESIPDKADNYKMSFTVSDIKDPIQIRTKGRPKVIMQLHVLQKINKMIEVLSNEGKLGGFDSLR